MAEKAELPLDTVSLPPTYAPSEDTFTESPPPAYKRPGTAAVRVARVICFTLLAMTFIIGFFVITHNWIQNKECNCAMDESNRVQHAALFGQALNLFDSDMNMKQVKDESPLPGTSPGGEDEGPLVPDQQQIVEMPKSEEEEKVDEKQVIETVQEQVEELTKNIQLPKNLLLGNSNLVGRNVHCKVEKRHRKISEGISTQAIIVTCDDDDADDDDDDGTNEDVEPSIPSSILPIRPPMSLLNSIMKVLSARPHSTDDNGHRGEIRPIPFPFPGTQEEGPIPIMRPIEGPLPGPFSGPFPGPFQDPLSTVFVPLRNIEMRRPFPPMNNKEFNHPNFYQRAPAPQLNEEREQHMMMFPPPRFMQDPEESHIERLPFLLPNGPLPIRIIRLPQMENDFNEEGNIHDEQGQNEGPLPFSIHPRMKMFPSRKRVIRLQPKESLDNSLNEPLPFPLSFPFPRGALPMHPFAEAPMPHPIPEASRRSLPSPVALPGVRVIRLPFRPQPQLFREAKVITHMEVRQSEQENLHQDPQNMNLQPSNVIENQSFRHNNKEFGPPKTHTVIEDAPLNIFGEDRSREEFLSHEPFHQEPFTQTQSQQRFLAPPPPSFEREGQTSLFAQLNPDAEVIPTNQYEKPYPTVHRIVLN